jgi:zona occludens toxin
MLVFNEGVPRSGKSYDAVLSHILPALKSGRVVYARINGLNHDKIADHLGLSPGIVRDLLREVPTADVLKTFQARKNEAGEWGIADDLKNALFVVDEAHEFYVASREAINPAIEQFFALCGQNGMDGVLMSQWYRRLHSSVRARIERKNVFQKLTAVGMTGKYLVTRFHTTTPDRFEKIGSDTCTYDPAIFPLYKGYADGASNVAVYKAGGKTVWHKIRKFALVMVPLVILGGVSLHHFFTDGGGLVRAKPAPRVVTVPAAPVARPETMAKVKPLEAPTTLHPAIDTTGMPPSVAYVFDLTAQARPRLVGWIEMAGKGTGLIEWREDQGHVLDRMTIAQLRSMGVTVEHYPYGLKVGYKGKVFIATSWPVDMPGTDAAANQARPVRPSAVSSPDLPVAQASSASAVASSDAAWPRPVTSHAYVPPTLLPRPVLDNWKPD